MCERRTKGRMDGGRWDVSASARIPKMITASDRRHFGGCGPALAARKFDAFLHIENGGIIGAVQKTIPPPQPRHPSGKFSERVSCSTP